MITRPTHGRSREFLNHHVKQTLGMNAYGQRLLAIHATRALAMCRVPDDYARS
jgi:hypothetical protein